MKNPRSIIKKIYLSLVIWGLGLSAVTAQSVSPNYRIDEGYIGSTGLLESNSPSYGLQSGTGGDIGIGGSESANFSQQAGFNTTNDPRLVFIVNTSTINFGTLSTAAASTATSTFSALNYTSYGYIVKVIGSPPTNGSYTLAGMSSTAPSQVGTEQFGINLKANTSPVSFGADPVQVPSSNFSYGTAATNYNTANNFRYVSGETIAQATKTSGQTDYTVSYIVNTSTTTAGGSYTGSLEFICIGTY